MSEYCVGGEDEITLPEAVVLPHSPVMSNSPINGNTTTLGLDTAGGSISTGTNNKQEKQNRCFNSEKFCASVKKTCFSDDVDDEDREKSTTTRDYFLLAMRDVFLSNIPYPATDEFSIKKRYVIGIISYCIYWVAFIMFFRQTYYDQTKNSPYVSTSYNAEVCEKVPISVTTSYYLDYNGWWEGKNSFAFYASPFRFQFTEFSVDSLAEFQAMMTDYKVSINRVGNYAASQPLVVNLVFWMSYIHYYYLDNPANTSYAKLGPDNLQYVEFTGDPSIVFKTSYRQAVASGYKGVCNSSALSTSYSQANAVFKVSLKQATFDKLMQNDACAASMNRNIFSSSWGNLDTDYSIELDVRSFTTALAVNMGVTELTTLGWSHAQPSYFEYNGSTYTLNEYFDPRIRMMEPIICISDFLWTSENNNATNVTMNDFCFVRYGNTVFLPVLNHLGTSLQRPVECNCEETADVEVCNQLNLLPSMLYYSTNENIAYSSYGTDGSWFSRTQLVKLLLLRFKFKNYLALNRAAYNASASAALSYLGHVPSYDAMGASWFEGAYDFCSLYNATTGITEYCSMVTFITIDQLSKRISPYHYELTAGHCKNTFSVLTDSEWERAFNPPLQIYETYYVCTQDMYSAVLNAIGLATGNIAVFFLVTFALSVPFVYMYLTCIYTPRKRIPLYNQDYVNAALQNFGTFLCHYAVKIQGGYSGMTSGDESNKKHSSSKESEKDIPWDNMQKKHISTIAKIVDEMTPFLTDPLVDNKGKRKESLGNKMLKKAEPYCGKLTMCQKQDANKQDDIDLESNAPTLASNPPPIPNLMSVNVNSKQSTAHQRKSKGKKSKKHSSE